MQLVSNIRPLFSFFFRRSIFGASPESLRLLRIFTAFLTFSLDISTKRFKVVPDQSSSFDSRKHGSDTIHANHMNMCRLNTKDDDGYEKFSGVLEKYIDQIRAEKNEANKVRRESQSETGLWSVYPSDCVSGELISFNIRSFELPRLRRAPITRASTAEP